MQQLELQEEGGFRYLEVGKGKTILLFHGLFGALSNFSDLIGEFSQNHRVLIPMLPLYDLPVKQTNLPSLVEFAHKFVEFKGIKSFISVGNSLGGHLALLYQLTFPGRMEAMVLTGSSGLFENTLGDTFPKRGNREFIHEKTACTFYDPEFATKELVDEVFGIVNNREKVIRVIAMAKSAVRNNLSEHLSKIKIPTLLIWGNDDIITPPFVGEDFHEHIKDSELFFIDKCGHAPMMEQPKKFNELLKNFLTKLPLNK